jgi:hypothetical protein
MSETPTPAPDTPQGSSVTTNAQEQAAAAAQMQSQARSLAMAIGDVSGPSGPDIDVLKGVVTAQVNPGTPPTVSVQLGGDSSTSVASVRYIDSYSPVVGDTVLILKRNNDLTVIGQMNDASTVAENGWTAPTLGSGFTTVALDPIMYRMVVDHGTNQVQFRGQVTVSGSPTALFTLPVGMRPVGNRPLVIARDTAGGSNTAVMTVNSDGTVVLSGGTTGPDGTSNTAGSGTTGGPSTNNTSYQDAGDGGSPGSPFAGGPTTASANGPDPHTHWVGGHAHNMSNHTHSVGSHSHTITTAADYPTSLSVNGVEVFL